MIDFFDDLNSFLQELPPSGAYTNGSCDAVALGISDFVLKHYPHLKPVYIIISRVTYDLDDNILDDNDCSHVVVSFQQKPSDKYETWDSNGKHALENWESDWFNETDTYTDFFNHEYKSESQLITTLYKGKHPVKDTLYDPIIRRTIFDYLELRYNHKPTDLNLMP